MLRVIESRTPRGHLRIHYWGPSTWATLYVTDDRCVVQHGTLDSSSPVGPGEFFPLDQEAAARRKAKRYAKGSVA